MVLFGKQPPRLTDYEVVFYETAALAMHALLMRGETNNIEITRKAFEIAKAIAKEGKLPIVLK
jgi:hypothetical protein